MDSVIRINNLTKKFGEEMVLKDITLNFERGKIHGIIGRNGCGKTVMFKCICGLIPYDSGEIYLEERIVGKEIQIPKDVGVIIEHPSFLMNYSGFRNLKMLADINGKIDSNHIRKIIKMVGLDYKSKKLVSKYSLGMKQRLGIAQAIMENNKILILDEPMNGLDNGGVESIRKLLIQLKNQGTTIILSSHNPEDIRIMCDTVHEMDRGVLIS